MGSSLAHDAGRFPREVHMHVRRRAIQTMATDDDGLHEVRPTPAYRMTFVPSGEMPRTSRPSRVWFLILAISTLLWCC